MELHSSYIKLKQKLSTDDAWEVRAGIAFAKDILNTLYYPFRLKKKKQERERGKIGVHTGL